MSRSQSEKQGRGSGFTLVEILIALTLFSVILVLVISALHTSNLSWQASQRQIAVNEDQRLVIAFIKRQLSQAVPLLQLDGRENNLLFKGEEDSIQFVSALPAHRGGGGLHLLSLQADQDLILHYQMVTSGISPAIETGDEKTKSQVLIADIGNIKFRYYGRNKNDDTPAWHHQWQDQKRLPELISLRIISSHSADYWPEVVIAVRTQITRGQPQFTIRNRNISARI